VYSSTKKFSVTDAKTENMVINTTNVTQKIAIRASHRRQPRRRVVNVPLISLTSGCMLSAFSVMEVLVTTLVVKRRLGPRLTTALNHSLSDQELLNTPQCLPKPAQTPCTSSAVAPRVPPPTPGLTSQLIIHWLPTVLPVPTRSSPASSRAQLHSTFSCTKFHRYKTKNSASYRLPRGGLIESQFPATTRSLTVVATTRSSHQSKSIPNS
jgi:hypothetical protein